MNIIKLGNAERALAASEFRYRRLFETTQDGILIVDEPTGQIVDVNPFLIDLLGYSREEYLGKKLWEIGFLKDVAASQAAFEEFRSKGHVRYENLPLETKDGRKAEVEFVSNVYDAGDQRVIQCNVRDITARKQAEATWRESDEKYRRLFEVTRDATMIAEAPSWKFTSGNSAALKMFGASNEEEFTSYGPWELSPERQRDGRASAEKAKAMIEVALRKGSNFFEWMYRRIDGAEFPADVLMTPLKEGKSLIIHSSVRDTSERKAAELALQESEERFRTLVEQAPEAILVYNFDLGRFVLANREAEKLFACSRAELLKGGPNHFYCADQPDARPSEDTFVEHNRQVLAGEAVTFERRICNAAGEERLCEVRLVPMPSSEGRLMRATYIDITDRVEALRRLERALEGTVAAVASTVERRDAYIAGHQQRVSLISVAIAKELGLSADKIQGLHLASTVHDLGKINIPAEILSKPGKLTQIEYEFIKTHPQVGYDILKTVEFPWPIADIVLQHHERLDGSGYPNGLKGDAILLEARILAVADVMESMTSHRPYRPALGIDAALAEIQQGRGKLYDPVVVDACLKLLSSGKLKLD